MWQLKFFHFESSKTCDVYMNQSLERAHGPLNASSVIRFPSRQKANLSVISYQHPSFCVQQHNLNLWMVQYLVCLVFGLPVLRSCYFLLFFNSTSTSCYKKDSKEGVDAPQAHWVTCEAALTTHLITHTQQLTERMMAWMETKGCSLTIETSIHWNTTSL